MSSTKDHHEAGKGENLRKLSDGKVKISLLLEESKISRKESSKPKNDKQMVYKKNEDLR